MNSLQFYIKLLNKGFPFICWKPLDAISSKDSNFFYNNILVCWYKPEFNTLCVTNIYTYATYTTDISKKLTHIWETLIILYE